MHNDNETAYITFSQRVSMVGMINTYKASRVANVSIYSPTNENYARLIHHSVKNVSPGKLSYFPEDLTISDVISSPSTPINDSINAIMTSHKNTE